MVWKLDRLARSLKQLIETVEEFGAHGVGLRSLTEAIDTTTVGGKLVFHHLRGPGRVRARRHPLCGTTSPDLFTTERRTPMSAAGFRKQLALIGVAAGLPFPIYPHMLRHACGFALANGKHDTRAIQEWLGHKNIQHTTRYTELTTHRFRDFWQRED